MYAAVVGAVFLLPVRRSDLMVFLAAGHNLLNGVNPYPGLGTPFLYSGSAFVYPWVAALPFIPLAMLPAGMADLFFFGASVAAVGLAVRWSGARGWAPYICVLGAATTIRGFQVGTLNAVLLLCTVAAWRYRDRLLPVAAALTAVVMTKVFLVPLAAWLALTRRWAALMVTAGMIATAFGVGFLLGPFGPTEYLTLLGELSSHETNSGWSLNRLFLQHGADPRMARVLVLGVAAILGVLAVAVWRRTRQDTVIFAAALLGALLICPIVWSHYLVLGFAPLLVARVRWGWLAGFAGLTWVSSPPVGGDNVFSAMVSSSARLALVQAALMLIFAVVCGRALDWSWQPVAQELAGRAAAFVSAARTNLRRVAVAAAAFALACGGILVISTPVQAAPTVMICPSDNANDPWCRSADARVNDTIEVSTPNRIVGLVYRQCSGLTARAFTGPDATGSGYVLRRDCRWHLLPSLQRKNVWSVRTYLPNQ